MRTYRKLESIPSSSSLSARTARSVSNTLELIHPKVKATWASVGSSPPTTNRSHSSLLFHHASERAFMSSGAALAFAPTNRSPRNGALPARSVMLSLVKLLLLAIGSTPLAHSAPVSGLSSTAVIKHGVESPEDPKLWVYLSTAIVLVLLGGAFAGLTIALMGQDEIYLRVIATSGEGAEKHNATKVLQLLKKGKHWVLVTLLLSNVITNETLPIVLDRSLGGGWPAVLSSTVLIVIFGEIVPQSICVRYGLPIGAFMSPLVLALMWIMAPVAWPTAKLLDKLLGQDHGTIYKKAGLKTLVTLHKTLGTAPEERLNQDEVTIISAVLDLKDKTVGSIMTPMSDVLTMSADTVLNEQVMDAILSAGYSRIPIHSPDNPENFMGMLLVKMLITYDPEDCLRVRDFSLATLPETRPQTSCLDIVNFFQEGKSHMVLVSSYPGESRGALGVVTLEDVIEELIGEEIIDESDVFIDVHKAIRRLAPAPRARIPRSEHLARTERAIGQSEDQHAGLNQQKSRPGPDITGVGRKASFPEMSSSPRTTTFLVRRKSGNSGIPGSGQPSHIEIRGDDPELRQHLKHLGPSNAAHKPKQTKINSVTIKPGIGSIPENPLPRPTGEITGPITEPVAHQSGVSEPLISGGFEARDGAQAVVSQGYGTLNNTIPEPDAKLRSADVHIDRDEGKLIIDTNSLKAPDRSGSQDTLGSGESPSVSSPHRSTTAKSGLIHENYIDLGGVKKMVLETTSGAEENEAAINVHIETNSKVDGEAESNTESKGKGKKKRKKRAGKKKNKEAGNSKGENEPLLGGSKD